MLGDSVKVQIFHRRRGVADPGECCEKRRRRRDGAPCNKCASPGFWGKGMGLFDYTSILRTKYSCGGRCCMPTGCPTAQPTRTPTTLHPTPMPTPPPYSEAQQKIDSKKMQNWERRRYVRRRNVPPTAADRRRRYKFPTPPPPARLPGAVCPCCPANQKAEDKSMACQVADTKEKEEKAVMDRKASKGHNIKSPVDNGVGL